MLRRRILGLGYVPSEQSEERSFWSKYDIIFDFAKDISDAVEQLKRQEYICIAIRSAQITHEDLCRLRQLSMIPTIILPQICSIEEVHTCADFSAIHYARAAGQGAIAMQGAGESLLYGLSLPSEKREALTIITLKDLSFCLEHRSVEVRGEEISLTEKEFDILALLLSNQRKVFSYEMIMDAVWHEDVSFFSSKAITTHISNLRRKLKIAPDVPEYIKSVRGVGYKFDIPK